MLKTRRVTITTFVEIYTVSEIIAINYTTISQPGGTRRKLSRSPKSVRFILWGLRMTVQHFRAIHPIVVEVFQSLAK